MSENIFVTRSNIIDITLGLIAYALMNWHSSFIRRKKTTVHNIFIQPKVLKILTVELHYYWR